MNFISCSRGPSMVDSNTLEYGPETVLLVFLLLQALGLEDSHIPTFWLLLYKGYTRPLL